MKHVVLSEIAPRGVSHDPGIPKRPMLDYGDIPGFGQFAQCEIPPGAHTAPHAHADMTEVFFVRSGYGVLRVGGATLPAVPGTCVRVDPGETHTIENPGPAPIDILYFGVPEAK